MSLLTRDRLLNEANLLMRMRGYSAFSYADLSKKIGITKASIHHHFATKDILGEAVVVRAIEESSVVFSSIESKSTSVRDRLTDYIEIFAEGYRTYLLPLCCALSADLANLPDNIKLQATSYFDFQINWLTRIISVGIASGEVSQSLDPDRTALIILNICEGASVVARATHKANIFEDSLEQILFILTANVAYTA
ncbi:MULTISPECIES: TetR/AcrR family transcriptional regulator [Pectobacterium]|uniref:TetR family transcriptional regulator n=1 Tax=Pectobacterium wasabiae TaxID=55208 RepID=A0AAW3EHI3_9GAMM|nr:MULTISPECIES: TetR/AcrR family transcriptional regulator [Pectobacterium]AOR65737.1 TetR family transcriptional regulator [Pectobacterium wasabiae CFBP 3304]EJS96687.1 TetR Family Transcriptional Regulator [Pectobacterium wasabiae CFBP 3304]KFX05530.1 TetR family transcriptional regulator [Pectobacterium wasabiae]KGA30384.1 TetR family transcriptional regulator [Pectobacterium wasabiae]KHS89425.1 TetR family transcriptional regulator [Pectobacterium brasiliense]